MKLGLKEYLTLLYQRIPDYVYEGGLALFLLGAVVVLLFWGFKNGWRKIAALLLTEHISILYCSTIIFRDTSESSQYKPLYFEQYKNAIEEVLVEPEMLMNVFVFIPVGILGCVAIKRIKMWQVVIFGCGISITIEVFQFISRRGTMEVEDIILNSLGCVVGIICCSLVRLTYRMICEYQYNRIVYKR